MPPSNALTGLDKRLAPGLRADGVDIFTMWQAGSNDGDCDYAYPRLAMLSASDFQPLQSQAKLTLEAEALPWAAVASFAPGAT